MPPVPFRRRLLRLLNGPLVRPFRRRTPAPNQVAIVIPLSLRAELSEDERISLRHLYHHLGHYDRFFLAPEGLHLEFPEREILRLPRRFFGSAGAHARLLYWSGFYRLFADYEYIFFYHLDALALSDELRDWCGRGYDYIGAPWLNCPDTPWVTAPRVGNCGFALLRVEAALRVLYRRYREQPSMYWLDLLTRNQDRLQFVFNGLRRLQQRFPRSRLIARPLEEAEQMQSPGPANRNTDIFWSDRATRFDPSFKVAPFAAGLQFAFEASPRTCLELNGGRLPFGCHAWPRYDREFWRPFLLDATARPPHSRTPAVATI